MFLQNSNEKIKKNRLSIIFPIYNEEKNISKLIKEIKRLINQNFFDLEIIFVNDGSKDNSKEIIQNYLKTLKTKKLINFKKNMGKGYALKIGVLNSTHNWILTSDADLSVSLKHITQWFKKKNFLVEDLVILQQEIIKTILKAYIHRKIIGYFYQLIIRLLFVNSISYIKDTQCGFKLYNSSYVKQIFSKITQNGFVHDVEIAILLHKKNIYVKEMPVKWVHGNASKVNLITDSLTMFCKIFFLKFKYKI